MKCNNCGYNVEDNKKICPFCGSKIEEQKTNDYDLTDREYDRIDQYDKANNINTQKETDTIIDKSEKVNSLSINDTSTIAISDAEFNNNRKFSVIAICVYFAIFYVIMSIVSEIVSFFAFTPIMDELNNLELPEGALLSDYLAEKHPDIYYQFLAINNLICYLLLLGSIIPLCYKFIVYDLKTLKANGAEFISFVVNSVLIFYGVSICANILVMVFSLAPIFDGIEQTTSSNQSAVENMLTNSTFTTIVTIFMTVIFAPIVEELIFRKCFFNLFKDKGWTTIIISGIAFGLIHVFEAILVQLLKDTPDIQIILYELVGLISYAASGIVLGYIYKKSNYNIWATIIVHSVANLISVVMTFSQL